jgi:hypothetical protein
MIAKVQWLSVPFHAVDVDIDALRLEVEMGDVATLSTAE